MYHDAPAGDHCGCINGGSHHGITQETQQEVFVINPIHDDGTSLMSIHSNSQQSSPSNSSSNPSSSLPSTNGPFPAGSYTFMTFLDAITTDCTSKPINWDCGSPSTYHESPSAASAIYQWIINGSSSDSTSTFSISSTDNPFAINFANVPLTLVDEHLQTERYTFVTKTNKVSLPSLGVRCYYNDVIFEGSLYTQRPKSYFGPSTGTTTAETPDATNSSSSAFENWKFAVDVKQSIGGGPNVPECYHVDNGVKGAKITDEITSETADDQCSCLYKNYDP